MMLRKLAVSLALAGILSTSNAYALGLGEIKIKSALNEPLDAEIELLDARKLNPLQIQPRMADIDEYALAGIDKQRYLSDVNFKVFVGPDGKGRIRLTSPGPIKEPFLNFLVELNWPNGRLVREYTLLLDPPVYNPVRQRLAAQPAVPAQPRAVVPAAPARPTAPVQNIRTEMDGKTQVFVDVHDSLWSIADKYRPNESVTKSQMALALLKKNPDAFVGGNINRMKAGVVLDLPTLEEIKALTPQQAAAEVQRQNRAWKNRNKPVAKQVQPAKPLVATVKAKPVEKKTAEDAKPAVAEADKPLIVARPLDVEAQPEQGGVDQKALQELEDARVALEQELEETNAELADQRAQYDLLNERLEMMQEQLSSIQATLASKDRTIEALEKRIEEQQAQLAEREKGFIEKLMEDPILLASIGGGLVAILAGVLVVLFLRRRKAKKAEEADGNSGELAAAAAAGAAAAVVADAVADEEEAPAEESAEASDDIAEVSVDDDMEDLSDLDLDMDLDLDLDATATDDVVEETDDDLGALLEDDEFDLGLDETDAEDGVVDSVATDVIEEDVNDAELEKLLAEDLGDDLADSSLDLDSDFDDAELEFESEAGGTATDADDLDAILSGDDDLEFTPPTTGVDDSALEELGLEDIGLDDLDAQSSDDDALDFNVGGSVDQADAAADVDADDIDALLAQASGDLDTVSESDEDLDIDDIDALLAQASGDLEAVADDAVEAEPALDELDESVLDADLEALLAETEQVADETEQQSEDVTDDLDIDDLLESAAIDSEPPVEQEKPSDALMAEESGQDDDDLDLELDADLTAGSIDDLLAEVAAGDTAEESASGKSSVDAIDDILAEVEAVEESAEEDVDVLMQDLSDLELDEELSAESTDGDLDALLAQVEEEASQSPEESELQPEDDLEALLAEVAGEEPDLELPVEAEDAAEIAAEPEESADDILASLELEDGDLLADLDLAEEEIVDEQPESDDLDALLAAESVAEHATEHLEALNEAQEDAAFDAEVEALLNEVTEKSAPEAESVGDAEASEPESAIPEPEMELDSDIDAELGLDNALEEIAQQPEEEVDAIDDVLAELDLDAAPELDTVDLADIDLDMLDQADPVVEDAPVAAESAEVEEPLADDADLADAVAELEKPLEVENLDDVDLDLGDMDLADLLEEVATADTETVDGDIELESVDSVTTEPEVEQPVAEPAPAVQDTADVESVLEGLEDLDDLDLAEMMAGLEGESSGALDLSDVESDLDSDLAALDRSLDELGGKAVPANPVEEELTANIAHDLDAELDSELQSLLDGSDSDIELEETGAEEEDLTEVDGWSLLESADEVETKLDLARAYMDMEDSDGASEILAEIVRDGSDKQKQEATALLESIKQ